MILFVSISKIKQYPLSLAARKQVKSFFLFSETREWIIFDASVATLAYILSPIGSNSLLIRKDWIIINLGIVLKLQVKTFPLFSDNIIWHPKYESAIYILG